MKHSTRHYVRRSLQQWGQQLGQNRPIFFSACAGILVLSAIFYLGWKSQNGVSHVGRIFAKRFELRVWANYLGQPAQLHLAQQLYIRAGLLESQLWLRRYPESELSLFNRASQTTPFVVHRVIPLTLARVSKTLRPTLGYADPSLKPLMEAYWPSDQLDEYLRAPASPEPADIQGMQAWIGLDKFGWDLDPPTIWKLHPRGYLDLDGWHEAILAEEAENAAAEEKASAVEVLANGVLHVWKTHAVDIGPASRDALKRLDVRDFPGTSGAFVWMDHAHGPKGRSPASYFQVVEPKSLAAGHSDVAASAAFCRHPVIAASWARAAINLGSDRAIKLANRYDVPLRLRTTDGTVVKSDNWARMVSEGAAPTNEVTCVPAQ